MHMLSDRRQWILRTVSAWCATVALCAVAIADWTVFDQLPGGARGRQLAGEFGRVGQAGSIRDIRWDLSNKTAWFRTGNDWFTVNLESGVISAEPIIGTPPLATPQDRKPSRLPPPGRGKQRLSETALVGGTGEARSAVSRDGNLMVKCEGADQRAVTSDARAGLNYATASWVYGEELDQTTGMWWSPTGNQLAFYRFNDEKVPVYNLLSGLTGLRTTVESERYPKPGDPNPIAQLCLLDVDAFCADKDADPAKFVRQIDVGLEDQYIYGVEYSPSGKELLFHRLNRRHDVLEWCAADATTGAVRVVVREQQPHWNHHLPEMRFLADGRRFIWSTERSGYKQYELRSLDDANFVSLTHGLFPAGEIESIDESNGQFFYTAFAAKTEINTQLMVAKLDGSGQRRLTPDDVNYSRFRFAPGGEFFASTDETVAVPPSTRIYSSQGKLIATIAQGAHDVWTSRNLRPPELRIFKASDGVTNLYGIVRYPSGFDPVKSWPLIVNVYGGPYFQNIFNRFSSPSAECELGFVTVQIDNRGTPGRGKVFEDATYLQLGITDLDDQAAAVNQLTIEPGLDPARVGITGMSYGGYISALALVRYPEVFQVAVAASGPMDWRHYDSIYTERFMRTPQENKRGYDAGSVLVHADKMRGKLLLIHGMQDDNVHPSNGWALAQKLYDRNFPFEMMFFPKAQHGGYGDAAYDATWSFFTRELKASPTGGVASSAP